jgi:NOL1/NOP2/fmu family ribosome biogenesis protein
MHPNAKTRQQILDVLYQAREAQSGNRAKDGWVTEADLKHAIGDINFALGVLTEIGHVKRDGYRLRITGAGVLACEAGQETD